MTRMLESIDQHTAFVGHNRLELLLFKLDAKRRFGINVFKVREIVKCPVLTRIPHAHHAVCGLMTMRGMSLAVIDLARALGEPPIMGKSDRFVIITEFNRHVQGFLVMGVDRIINVNWETIHLPPKNIGCESYMTAVTEFEGELIEIIDVEKVLAEITGPEKEVPLALREQAKALQARVGPRVLVVDDSVVARRQIAHALDQIGVDYEVACNGKEALHRLQKCIDEQKMPLSRAFAMIISDIEMPEMDGYTLAKYIKNDDRMSDLYVLLHTSLSGVFNETMVRKVGADKFLPKYSAEELSTVVLNRLKALFEAESSRRSMQA
nr:chemotaxis protein CheV [Gammaproteobacteria bacterium]